MSKRKAPQRPGFTRAQVDAIRSQITLSEVIGETVVLKRQGRELVGLCPFHLEKTPSFSVNDQKGLFRCYGCPAKGDVFEFIMQRDGLSFPAAVREVAGLIGTEIEPARVEQANARRAEAEAEDREKREKHVEAAREIWRQAAPIKGTLAERYLRARGIRIELPPTLRYSVIDYFSEPGATPVLKPAMIAAVQGPGGGITGIHRTYLTDDGRARVAKRMLGICFGGAVRLAAAGPDLGLGEGIETSLTVRQSKLAAKVDWPVWATLSLGNFWIQLPRQVRHVCLCADNDAKKPDEAEAYLRKHAARYCREGRRVSIARADADTDFNDMIRAEAQPPAAAVTSDAPF